MDYGKIISEERKKRGVSLKELWKISGIRDTTISNWEHGHVPPVDKLDKVLAALNISITIGKQ